jgi:hypothetical protein
VSKLDKKTKKEIREVIQKYIRVDNRTFIKRTGIISGTLIGLGLGLDLLLTGGLFSAGTFIMGGLGCGAGVLGSTAVLHDSIKKSRTNTAAQTLNCDLDVEGILLTMESSLRRAFGKAAAPDAAPEDKDKFLLLADEIERDAKKLSPAFKIVSGGPNGFGTDRYEFIIDEKKLITIDQARHDVTQPSPPPPPKKLTPEQEEIQRLKKRIEILENPPVVRLDKNPPQP